MLTEYPDVLTVPEVAKILRISRSSAYHLIQCGEIPGHRTGGNVRVIKSKLIRHLEGNNDGKRSR